MAVGYTRIACGGTLGLLLLATSLTAGPLFNSLEFLRFSAPVRLPGVALVAGEYAFEVGQVDGCDVVRVRYRRTNRVTFTGPAQRIGRPKGMSLQRSVILGTPRPGEVAPILAWFPMDELMGYQFIYDQVPIETNEQVTSYKLQVTNGRCASQKVCFELVTWNL